ncbi:c-type cytochrome [Occallatibacter savannae]|uniref:c-type cytochrome n=1 Tax=Occallatibacter savannae TaxID=1002691 RepID=UPI000D685EB1|nr:c-type cytochrome [Occallatibacter savannae]
MSGKGARRFWVVLGWSWGACTLAILLYPTQGVTEVGPRVNAANGKVLFEKRCTGCHSLDKNKEGPRLAGVYGRKAGAVADFSYSAELKAAKITWDGPMLDRWLANPDAVVKDNDMAFHVADPRERGDIIEFLRVVSSGK